MEKIILTDCDGVLCNWNDAFDAFMLEDYGLNRIPDTDSSYNLTDRFGIEIHRAYQLVGEFNNSNRIERLKPFADSVEYVSKLAEQGFRFIVLSSLSDNPVAQEFRRKNVVDIFGNIFDDVICIKAGASKGERLKQWAGSRYFWIEDHTRQAEAGYEAGLRTVLIDHPYNRHYQTDLFPRVSYETPWKEIYSLVAEKYNLD